MNIKMRLYYFLILSLLLLPNYVYAIELQGEFLLKNGQVYEDYAYATYSIEATGDPLSIAVNSSKLDTYLIVQAPDKSFSTYDDFYEDNPKTSTNDDIHKYRAGITVNKPSLGKYIIIATTYSTKEVGFFSLVVNGATKITTIAKEQLDKNLLEDAFAKRNIYSERKRLELEKERKRKEEIEKARKITLLGDQLTLASYRTELIIKLNEQINAEDKEYTEETKRLEVLIEDEKKLKEAMSDVKKLSTNEILTKIIKKEIDSNSSSISYLSKQLSEKVSKKEAFKIALEKIQKLDEISKELERLKQDILNSKDHNSFENNKNKITQLQIKVEQLAKEIAEKLFNSSFAKYLQLGAYHKFYHVNDDRSVHFFNIIQAESMPSPPAPMYRSDSAPMSLLTRNHIDPAIWLPELFPWPPPMASSMTILDDYYNLKHPFKSLGEVDALIRQALDSTGYASSHYFGVPDGFALITQLEQINDNAVPLDGVARWSTNISEMKAFTLTEYLKALVTAKPGYYRVIAFIVSSQAFSTTDNRAKFSTIQNWANKGFSSLPNSLKSKPYSDEHKTTVLVYEFLKRKISDEPSTSIPGRHIAKDHLEKTKILAYLKN